jgi:type I restriction enzyme S subunit
MEEWKEYNIGQLCRSVCSGGTPSSKCSEYYDGDIPWLNTKEINFNRIYGTEKFITEEGFNNSSTKWISEDSVIVAMYGATAGKAAIFT